MKVELEHRQRRRSWLAYSLTIAVSLAALTALLFPWGTSAYYLERAGQQLETDSPTDVAYQVAECELQQALKWHPNNAQAYRLLAQVHSQQGDWPGAAKALAHYVTLKPNNPLGYWKLSLACEQIAACELAHLTGHSCGTDEKDRQAVLVRLWQEAGQSAADFVRAGDELSRAKDWTQAEAFYRRALLLEPEEAAAWYGLGEAYLARDEPGAALEAYARVVALSSDPPLTAKAYQRRGQILADTQRWDEASAELAQAVELAPDWGQYHLNYGWYLYKAGRPLHQARAELEKASHLLSDSPWPFLRLADLDFAEKDYVGMLTNAQQAIEAKSTQFWGWLLRGRALRHLNRFGEAEQSLRHAVDLAPDKAAPYAELGKVLKQQDRLEEAIHQYEQAIALAPGNVEYHLSLGDAYRANGQTAQAVRTYQRVLKLDPDNAIAQQALRDLGFQAPD